MTAARLIARFLLALPIRAQTTPWTTVLRGSWVRTSPAAAGDVSLASKEAVSQIDVGDGENAAVPKRSALQTRDLEDRN
jgi:hypothetical protein